MNRCSRLFHYSAQHVALKPRHYQQRLDFKPQGFWVSVGDDWAQWCESENFQIESISIRHHVELAECARILRLATAKDIDQFNEQFGARVRTGAYFAIDWPRVAEKWQGIVIAPYCRARRMDIRTVWYSTWDCASGCIWNLSAIQSIEPVISVGGKR